MLKAQTKTKLESKFREIDSTKIVNWQVFINSKNFFFVDPFGKLDVFKSRKI